MFGSSEVVHSFTHFAFMALIVAVWAGLTEELIYRGMLISALRRSKFNLSTRRKDSLAIVVSALIFGIGHVPFWGVPMSLAVTGVGVGFGVAYIATGELLVPVILYHIGFDLISILVSHFISF